MTKRLLKAAFVSGLLLTLVEAQIHSGIGQGDVQATSLGAPAPTATHASKPRLHALAGPADCTATANLVSPSSGQFSSFGGPTSITINVPAGGLDYDQLNNHVSVLIYDAAGRSALLTASSGVAANSNGSYSGSALLPYGGVAGGADTIVVAANGPKCLSAPFTVNPTIQVSPGAGSAFRFNGVGFHANSVLKVTFTQGGTPITIDLGGQSTDSIGQAQGASVRIPSSATQGSGTVTIADSQGSSATASFTFGPDPTPFPFPSDTPRPIIQYTGTPIPPPPGSTSTPGPPQGSATITPTPGPRTNTATSTPFPSFTSVPFTSKSATVTPFPSSTFPTRGTPTKTPVKGTPTATPTTGTQGNTAAAGAFTNGAFDKGLAGWSVSALKSVTVQSKVRHTAHFAAALSASPKTAVTLQQSFAFNGSTQSITFYYLNQAQAATAQLLANGRVVVGRSLLPTKGTSFLPGVLTLPSTVQTKDTLTVLITTKNGKVYLAEVNLSKLAQGFR